MIEQICLNEVILESVKEVFQTMVFMDLTEAVEPDESVEGWALLGSITFKGSLEGCLAVSCSTQCAQAITMNMLGIDTAEELTEEDTCDAVGEIVNMIMGGVKSRLQGKMGDLEVSIPSVVSGRQIRSSSGDNWRKTSTKVNIEGEYLAELSLLYRESNG